MLCSCILCGGGADVAGVVSIGVRWWGRSDQEDEDEVLITRSLNGRDYRMEIVTSRTKYVALDVVVRGENGTTRTVMQLPMLR